jgi:hypothetical protein
VASRRERERELPSLSDGRIRNLEGRLSLAPREVLVGVLLAEPRKERCNGNKIWQVFVLDRDMSITVVGSEQEREGGRELRSRVVRSVELVRPRTFIVIFGRPIWRDSSRRSGLNSQHQPKRPQTTSISSTVTIEPLQRRN